MVGDAVNTASRIEQLNKHLGTRILATRAVVEEVPDLAMRRLGRFQLFGKEGILEMIEILDTAEAAHKQKLILNFTRALAAFENKRQRRAKDLFDEIVSEFGDETARFYSKACRSRTSSSGLDEKGGFVCLKSK